MADADPAAIPAPPVLDLERLPTVELNKFHLADHKIVGSNSRDSRSRAFNLLRTRLVNILEGHSPRLVGITSATPAAGKSFISTNLAMSLAKVAEGPVILVDLDLRRGSVAAELGGARWASAVVTGGTGSVWAMVRNSSSRRAASRSERRSRPGRQGRAVRRCVISSATTMSSVRARKAINPVMAGSLSS